MKIKTRNITICLSLCFCFYVTVEIALKVWGDNRLSINAECNAVKDSHNIVFLGDSQVWLGINTATVRNYFKSQNKADITFYNFGYPATPIAVHYFMLEKVISQNKKPDYLIYGFWGDGLTNTDYPDTYYMPELAKWSELKEVLMMKNPPALPSVRDAFYLLLGKISRIYRYRHLIRTAFNERILLNREGEKTLAELDRAGGRDYRDIIKKDGIKRLIEDQNRLLESGLGDNDMIRFRERTYLDKMIRLCSENNIKLILVHMPVPRPVWEMQNNEGSRYYGYSRRLEQHLSKRGVPLFDFADDMPDEYIPDTLHLTPQGAKIFSKILAERIYNYVHKE